MATFTAAIHIGIGHPNDGGLIDPPGADPWFLSEGARPIWLQNLDNSHHRRRGWLPRSPTSVLRDGLVSIFLSRLTEDDMTLLPQRIRDVLKDRKFDLLKLLPRDYEAAISIAVGRAAMFGGKIIVSGFHGSIILDQFDAVHEFDINVELLAPAGNRYWSQWRSEVICTGLLAEL